MLDSSFNRQIGFRNLIRKFEHFLQWNRRGSWELCHYMLDAGHQLAIINHSFYLMECFRPQFCSAKFGFDSDRFRIKSFIKLILLSSLNEMSMVLRGEQRWLIFKALHIAFHKIAS